MAFRLALALAWLSIAGAAAAQTSPPDAIEKLVARLEQALASGDRNALLALTIKDTDASTIDEFAEAAGDKPTRVVIKERDRLTLEDKRLELLIEVFVERGIEGKLSTWRVALRPPPARGDPSDWRIEGMEAISNVAGLYRLALTSTKQFDVRNLVVTGTDVTVEMAAGHGVRRGDSRGPDGDRPARAGRFRFAPPETGERTQIGSSPAPTICNRTSTPRSSASAPRTSRRGSRPSRSCRAPWRRPSCGAPPRSSTSTCRARSRST